MGIVYDQSGHMIDDVRAKGYTGYFVNPGDMGVWPFKDKGSQGQGQNARGGKYQGQGVDVVSNKTGYSFVSPKAGLTWAQLKERWQKKREERAAKKQSQAPVQPEQRAPEQRAPEQRVPVQPAPQASAVPPTQNEIIKGTNAAMQAGVPYENKNGEKRVFVPSQNNDPARANIGGGVAKGVANRETAKQAAQAPANYAPSSEEAAKFYARTQMNKAAQQGRANAQVTQPAQPAQMQAGQLWQAQSIDPDTQKLLAQKKAQAMTASQARDEYWRRNLGKAQQDLRNGALDFGE